MNLQLLLKDIKDVLNYYVFRPSSLKLEDFYLFKQGFQEFVVKWRSWQVGEDRVDVVVDKYYVYIYLNDRLYFERRIYRFPFF